MPTLKYINRIRRIDQLIRLQNTGGPAELAKKIGVSERIVYDYINFMRELGAPIKYCPYTNSYIYTEEGRLQITFKGKNPVEQKKFSFFSTFAK